MDDGYYEAEVESYCFAVGDRAYCVWDTDINKRNLDFLRSLDPSYFDYVARANVENLDTADHARAATAIRSAYHHGLETLFALVFAVLQSPGHIAAWMQIYTPSQLRRLVAVVDDRNLGLPYTKLKGGDEKLTWERISKALNSPNESEERRQEIREEFAWLWKRFARDFLNDRFDNEYNSIKHGLRAGPGGFSMSIGPQAEKGKAAPPESMISMGGSKYGSTFLVPRRLAQKGERKGKAFSARDNTHFQLRNQHLNWDPKGLSTALSLLSVSLNNVVNEARRLAGDDLLELDFKIPETTVKDLPLGWVEGVNARDLDHSLQADGLPNYSREQILSVYRRKDSGEEET